MATDQEIRERLSWSPDMLLDACFAALAHLLGKSLAACIVFQRPTTPTNESWRKMASEVLVRWDLRYWQGDIAQVLPGPCRTEKQSARKIRKSSPFLGDPVEGSLALNPAAVFKALFYGNIGLMYHIQSATSSPGKEFSRVQPMRSSSYPRNERVTGVSSAFSGVSLCGLRDRGRPYVS